MRRILFVIGFAATLIIAALTQNDAWHSYSFTLGVVHPLLGVDHILVMIGVGFWAVRLGGRSLWVLPLTFLATMILGFVSASVGFQAPLVEPAIWSSIIALGLLVALAVKTPVWLGALITALFAFFHGHAHGTEATVANLTSYAVGFTLATAALHALGIGLGIFAFRSIRQVALRAMGGITALIGLALMVL